MTGSRFNTEFGFGHSGLVHVQRRCPDGTHFDVVPSCRHHVDFEINRFNDGDTLEFCWSLKTYHVEVPGSEDKYHCHLLLWLARDELTHIRDYLDFVLTLPDIPKEGDDG